ncbi:MAG: response regulator [Clostridiales bacterium]|nr:response regulator [Clostridiales bacterium]
MKHPYGSATGSSQPSAGKEQVSLNSWKTSMLRYLLDEDLTILEANDRFYESTGYPPEEFRRLFPSLRQYYGDGSADFASLKDSLAGALENGETEASLTLRFPVKEGPPSFTRISATIGEEPVDGSRVILAVHTDVSDILNLQRETSRRYEEKAQGFEWMMESYVGNIYISDMESYELLYLNQTACGTLGMPLEKVLGRKCYEVIQGRTSPCPFCTNSRLREDEFYEWEFDNPLLKRTFMIKNRIINWNGHRARIELSHDMFSTEYKLAKKDREREALLRTIPGGFARVDARDNATVLWYDASFLQMIGYTKEQFETGLNSRCSYVHPDDQERLTAMMKETRETGQSAVFESRVIAHNGESRILTTTLCYVSGEDSWDRIPSYYSIVIDVTKERAEQARQRKALEDAYQAARVASSAKTNFLSSMSHDIRTPMNAIMGMTAIAQMNLTSPDRVHDCLKKIDVSSRHLLSLINEILDMSKIESGKIDLIPENINLPDLVQNVADMCQPLITEKHQEFQMSVGRVQHERVVADGDRLQQVFMNLLSNAIKYTPDGGIISLRINELPSPAPQKSQYEFIFTDNGIGMSAEFISHIFEPFSRAEDSRISKIQGTGLGMAITENIVHMMNGTIEVKSRLDVGSRITVSIPLELLPDELPDDIELKGLPVLVVDDDQVVCENAAALLGELGMRGYWVLSGPEAIHRVVKAHDQADDFFAVILDWKMPEMGGLQTVTALRKEMGEDVPIIIISAYDYSNIEEEFVRAGADAFITKPLFKSKMLHVLQLFCTSSKMETATALAEEKHSALQGKRVLLVEDNDLNREIAVELLQLQGITVDSVENGKYAVDAFQNSSAGDYAAILMDIQMPVMNGYDATAAIRSLGRDDARTIPILALTANAFAADVGKAFSVGMNDHIAKPLDVKRLIEVLQKWIG